MKLLKEQISILRQSENGQYIDGTYVPSSRESLTVEGRIQTDKQDRTLIATEQKTSYMGRDLDGWILIYSVSELKTSRKVGLTKADLVIYNDMKYRVMSESGLVQLGKINYYQYSAEYTEKSE